MTHIVYGSAGTLSNSIILNHPDCNSQGTGVHIVMSAKTALELGAPIRGILLAFTSTST
jgi:hypothetical protein